MTYETLIISKGLWSTLLRHVRSRVFVSTGWRKDSFMIYYISDSTNPWGIARINENTRAVSVTVTSQQLFFVKLSHFFVQDEPFENFNKVTKDASTLCTGVKIQNKSILQNMSPNFCKCVISQKILFYIVLFCKVKLSKMVSIKTNKIKKRTALFSAA